MKVTKCLASFPGSPLASTKNRKGGGEPGTDSHVISRHNDVTAIITKGRTKFTTSGAHDVIAITSPQKNDLCTEELRDGAKSLD